MKCTFSELRNKEVISTSTGGRIGFIDDMEIDARTGKILSLIIYGRPRIMGLLGRDDNVVISCNDIEKIGMDTVLVKIRDDDLYKMHKDEHDDLFD
ncbi:MAG: YlmC/YmxH family sporulation protein [Oscillospiraceae bacterium]|nr:YlmC/YmxH family sporulation protein [Oscillospiraceae bacterium]